MQRRRTTLIPFYLALALLLTVVMCHGTQAPTDKSRSEDDKMFQTHMEELLKTYNIPSVTACILKRDADGLWNIAWKGAYGNRVAIWAKIRADLDTIYAIGSITKTFTATAVMQLAEKGLIDLDADISTYMPFAIRNPGLNYNDPLNPIPPITVRDLLSHRSGLPMLDMNFFARHKIFILLEFGIFKDVNDLRDYLKRPEAWAHSCPDDPHKRMYYRPGERFSYSNVGYLILAYMIEEVINRHKAELGITVQHMTWREYIYTYILNPLGMHSTKFTWQEYPLWGIKRAQGYIERRYVARINPAYPRDQNGNPLPGPAYYAPGVSMPREIFVPQKQPLRNPTIGFLYNAGGAAGEMKSTVTDLASFMIVHLNSGLGYKRDEKGNTLPGPNGRPQTIRILSAESVNAMHAVHDPRLVPTTLACGTSDDAELAKMTGYGLGWMSANLGGRYWNYPWNPDLNSQYRVDWQLLRHAGIVPQPMHRSKGRDEGGGLNVEGNAGDLPGYHAGMYRVADNLAIIYFMNENLADEMHDESMIQPQKFKRYTSAHDGGPEFKTLGGAFPHWLVKISELQYLLLQKAASLKS